MPNKGNLDYVLQSVLSIGNKEANAQYGPVIFSQHFNIVTSFIIDKCIEAYPNHLDVLRPFITTKKIAITDGNIILPDDYRNILGVPSISAKKDGSGECSDAPITETDFKRDILKSGCRTRPIEMIDENQWDNRTTSTYKAPTYINPIGCFFGKRSIRICPYDLSKVELRYVKKELQYKYNYIINPDDTYLFNPVGSVESEWEDSASQLLVKGVLSLYSAYLRDNQLSQFSAVLNQAGLF